MLIFIHVMINQQKKFIQHELVKSASSLASILATSSKSWLLAHDYSGLQEVVFAQKENTNLEMAMVIAPDGEILAHTDPNKIGLYVNNIRGIDIFSTTNLKIQTTVSEDSISSIAIISSYSVEIGKVWIILSQKAYSNSLNQIYSYGFLYVILAIFIGVTIAAIVVNAMTKRLLQLTEVAKAISKGERNLRVHITSQDEIGKLGAGFNSMLESLEQKEKSLVIAQRNADLANQATSIFLSNMSHEIRTPMNAIVGMADLLSDTKLDSTQAKYVDIFKKAGFNLLHIIDDILDISKIESGNLELTKSEFNIKTLVKEVTDILKIKAKEKKADTNL